MTKKMIMLPTPSFISINWNMGSILGTIMTSQVISGILLSMSYTNNISMAFKTSMLISRNVNMGFIFKNLHMNMASMIFIIMYMHIFRSMINNSFKIKKTWMSGNTMLLMTMMSAFLGYILPWGQMSFWGATVITNLLSSIPYMGNELTKIMWGNFSVSNPTLNRFFSLHFMIPMLILITSIIHINSLHKKGSSNQLGMNSNIEKSSFHPIFSIKDLMMIMIMMMIIMNLMMIKNKTFMEAENFIMANPTNTPLHIKPEWYFLFAYSILRSIPNKLGGVMAMISSILILMMLIFSKKKKTSKFNIKNKMTNMMLIKTFLMISILGAKQIEAPFMEMAKTYSLIYFILMMMKI